MSLAPHIFLSQHSVEPKRKRKIRKKSRASKGEFLPLSPVPRGLPPTSLVPEGPGSGLQGCQQRSLFHRKQSHREGSWEGN